MSDLAPYSITIEQRMDGRWHWRVRRDYEEGPSLYREGFFRDYGFGDEKTRDKAEAAGRGFVARHRKYVEAMERDRQIREGTREVIT